MRTVRRSIITSLSLASVLLTAPAVFAQSATIDLGSEKQAIRGYGGINHPAWAGDLTAAQRETAFGNGPNQIGMTILRVYVDDNSANWTANVATAKRAQELGATIFASPWNPPAAMTEVVNGSKRLKHDQYAAYAAHLNSYVTFMKNNGVDIYAISVQNEPDYAEEWTAWTPDEILTFMKNNAGSLNTRVIAPESFQYRKQMSDPILNDATALANLDILGAHLYGTPVNQLPYPLFKTKGSGKELWMTEVYTESANDADVWPLALDVAYNIHNSMVEAEFNVYTWWYIRRKYSPMREDGGVSKRGFCMAQFSKFVRPGFLRVDATKSPTTDVYVSAYKSPADDKVAVVLVNRSGSAKSLTLNLADDGIDEYEKYTTSSSKSLQDDGAITATADSFQVTLDAQSVTTLYGVKADSGGGTGGASGTGGAGTGGEGSTIECTASATDAYQATPASIPGLLEAEDFDTNGYSDSSAGNESGEYRTDVDVDIKTLGTGYAVGLATSGEWLEYTVNVQTAGTYEITFLAGAVEAGRTFDVSVCGVQAATVEVPTVADWGTTGSVTATVQLGAGLQVIRLTIGAADYLDLDSMNFDLIAAADPGGNGGAGSGGTTGAGTGGLLNGGTDGGPVDGSGAAPGCGCTTSGADGGAASGLLALVLGAFGAARRRRRTAA